MGQGRCRNDEQYSNKIGPIGFKEKASCRLVDVPYYHITTPAINNALRCVHEEKQEEARWGVAEEAQQGQDNPAEGFQPRSGELCLAEWLEDALGS
jgi:hypothetical protein